MAFRQRYFRTKAWIHECCLGSIMRHFCSWWHVVGLQNVGSWHLSADATPFPEAGN
jgi:hypothetical protein